MAETEHMVCKGLAGYKQAYLAKTRQDPKSLADLKMRLETKILEYDLKEKEKEEALKEDGPDDDGWTVVTRVGKNKGAPRTEAEDRRVKKKNDRKRKRKEMTNFYAFQNREEKKQRIEELRNQFQIDKNKVEAMKAQRKFKPF